MADVDLSDFDALSRTLARIPGLSLEAAEYAMNRVLLFMLGKMPPYPATPAPDGHWLAKFASPKQQAWFFWAVRTGQPEVRGWRWAGDHPEGQTRRTGSLRKITTNVTRSEQEGQVIGEIGIKSNSAPWVMGPDFPGRTFELGGYSKPMYQARIHQNRWWQFEKVVKENLEQAHALFESFFWEKLAQLTARQNG